MRRLIALAIVLVAVAVAIAAVLIDYSPTPRTTLADGIEVRTVGEALAMREDHDETQPIAVRGWYSSGFPHSCPAPIGPDGKLRITSPLELYCRRGEVALTELEEAVVIVDIDRQGDTTSVSSRVRPLTGPHLDPVEIGYYTDIPITPPNVQPWIPQPIVAVGHFGDHRATDCQPQDVAFCRAAFVIDHLAVVRGESQGTVRQPIPGLDPAVQTPQDVEQRVRQRLGDDIAILSTAAYRGADLRTVEDRAPRIADRAAAWLVVVIDRGPQGANAPHLVSVLVDDVAGAVTWSSDAPS
jgi:hypothetical protein